MARAIEYIAEADEEGAKRLIKSLLDPTPDPARVKMIRDALAKKFDVR